MRRPYRSSRLRYSPAVRVPDEIDVMEMSKLLLRRRKAVTAVITGAMFIFILLVGFTLLTWNAQLYDNYLGNMGLNGNVSYQTSAELLLVTGFKFNKNIMNLTITNNSPVTVRIISLWLSNVSASPVWHKSFTVSLYINPFKTIPNVGQTVGTVYPSLLYTVRLVTDRGNLFGATNYKKTTIVGIAQSMGWISFDWDTYAWTSLNYQSPQPAWNISSSGVGSPIQFQINATNHWDKPLTLLRYTYLRMDKSTGGGSSMVFYIMDPTSTASGSPGPTCYNPSSPITLYPSSTGNYEAGGTPVTLKLLGQVASPDNNCNKSQNLVTDKFAVFLVIYYMYYIGSKPYYLAQTIPFEATIIS